MDRIIIGTGRCGSTLLSNLMSLHPDVMVLSEFFRGLDPAQGWPVDRPVSAQEFVDILSREEGVGPVYMAHNRNIGETLLDVREEVTQRRFISRPTITLIALRFLSENPDTLFAEIVSAVQGYPTQPLRDHFVALIEFLRRKCGKKAWIERSGLSTNIFREIRQIFPDGKYVHIHRDGGETVLSMKHHLHMSIFASYFSDPPTDEELRRTLDLSIPTELNPMMKRADEGMPLARYAEYWTHSLVMAYREMQFLAPDQLLGVRYEDLVENPRETLRRVAEFYGLDADEGWLVAAVSGVNATPTRVDMLDPKARKKLRTACWLGDILNGRDSGVSPADVASGRLVHLRKQMLREGVHGE